jgi:hypothetical protein
LFAPGVLAFARFAMFAGIEHSILPVASARAAAERLAPKIENPNYLDRGGFFWSGGVVIESSKDVRYNPTVRPSSALVNQETRPTSGSWSAA